MAVIDALPMSNAVNDAGGDWHFLIVWKWIPAIIFNDLDFGIIMLDDLAHLAATRHIPLAEPSNRLSLAHQFD